MAPDGVGEGLTGGGEEAEFAEGGLAVELDDLGVVTDDGERAAEGGGGEFVASEVDVAPAHWVELGLTVVAVVEELPLRGYGDIGHGEREIWNNTLDWDQGAIMDMRN